MKKIFFMLIVAVMILSACQPKPEPAAAVDTAAEKDAVAKVLEQLNSSIINKNFEAFSALLAEDGLYTGTDASEFWDKAALSEMIKVAFADTTTALNFTVNKTTIRVAADGKSAIAVEQGNMNSYGDKLPIRYISHLVKKDGNWIIDFHSSNFTPKNIDIVKIFQALE
jgi:uncharacterized protein (TIGR02246 family)